MTKTSLCLAWIVIAVVLHVETGVAQPRWEYIPEAERIFSQALENFRRGEHRLAADRFHSLVTLPPHQRTTASYLMLGKSLYNLKQYRESVGWLRRLVDKYPESSYIGDAYYMLGLNFVMQRRYDDALLQFLQAMEVSTDPKTYTQAMHLFESVAGHRLSIPAMVELLGYVHDPESYDLLSLKLAERYAAEGNPILAERMLQPVLERKERTKHFASAVALAENLKRGINVRIGVLLPLMANTQHHALKEFGEDFLLGIEMAIEEKREAFPHVNITTVVRDTERDPVLATRRAQELCNDPSVLAIIGPVFSNEAIAAAGIANAKKVPMITPTANADGIAAVGRYIFQANPDFSTRGQAAAKYAVSVLGLHSLAIVAPNEGPGRAMAIAFEQEALRRGARVLAIEWYSAGATDLREQFMRLRRAAMIEGAEPMITFDSRIGPSDIVRLIQAGATPRVIDSLMEVSGSIGVFALFGPNGKRIADSLQLTTFSAEPKIDNLEYIAEGIQGIFMPVSGHDEIGILTSQLAYYGIRTQIVGSPEWNDLVALDGNRRYTEGAIFVSEIDVNPDDRAYAQFVRRFVVKHRNRPSNNVLLGYGAASLLLETIFSGAMNREDIAVALAKVEDFPALHNTITLNPRRVNSHLHVLQYRHGEIQKIGTIEVH